MLLNGYLHSTFKGFGFGQENLLHTVMFAFGYFVSELCPFDCFMLILYINSCTLHNTVTIQDSFMKFYRNMYYVKMVCRKRDDCSPSLTFQVMPLDFLNSCMRHNSVTIRDIFMHFIRMRIRSERSVAYNKVWFWLHHFRVLSLWFFALILYIHSCTLHDNLVTVRDVFLQLYRKVY